MTHHTRDTLALHQIYKEYRQGEKIISVLCDINVKFQQGFSYAITGVSGSGKSTLLHLLGGLDIPTQGTVTFNGKNITLFGPTHKDTFLNQNIGFVFQFHYLVKELSVLENVMLMGMIKGETRKYCLHRAEQLLNMVGLADKSNTYTTQLSGGEQQRVAIARALFNRPSFLLADEPTGNLDAGNAQQIIDLFFAAQKEWGMGIVVCTHDIAVYARMDTMYRLCNRSMVIERG